MEGVLKRPCFLLANNRSHDIDIHHCKDREKYLTCFSINYYSVEFGADDDHDHDHGTHDMVQIIH